MKRILVVDDEPDVAELIKIFLNNIGYEADVFLSARNQWRLFLTINIGRYSATI